MQEIIVVIEGGVVQEVQALGLGGDVKVTVLDWDEEEFEEENEALCRRIEDEKGWEGIY